LKLDPAFGYLIVGGVALLLAVAGAHKLRNLSLFTEVFAAYRVLPEAWARRFAAFIPCIEIAIAASLLWEPWRPSAAAAALGLLLAYAAALGLNLLRGRRELDCGCGPAGNRRPIAAWMVWRNLCVALALGIAVLPWAARPLSAADLLTVMGGLAVAAVLYAAVDQLLGEVAPKALRLHGGPA
jgi:Methylamine utilisation protein MauE